MPYIGVDIPEDNRRRWAEAFWVCYRAECKSCGLVWPVRVRQGAEPMVWFRCPSCLHGQVQVDFGDELPVELWERAVALGESRSMVEQWMEPGLVEKWRTLRGRYQNGQDDWRELVRGTDGPGS